jgi:hypothetical protein
MGLDGGTVGVQTVGGTHGWTNGEEPMFFFLAGKGKWISMCVRVDQTFETSFCYIFLHG